MGRESVPVHWVVIVSPPPDGLATATPPPEPPTQTLFAWGPGGGGHSGEPPRHNHPRKLHFRGARYRATPSAEGNFGCDGIRGESQIFQNLVQAFGAVECVVVFKFDFRDVLLIQARCQFITDCFGYFVQSALDRFNVWVARVIIQMHKLGAATRSRTNQ